MSSPRECLEEAHDQTEGKGFGIRSCDSRSRESDGLSLSKQRGTVLRRDKMDFISYQEEIDGRRDRYERIVKMSRDIIIEWKILEETERRLDGVRCNMIRQAAKELCGLDQYFYMKSYDWAVEEYIEACAFYKFLKSGEVLLYSEVIDALYFDQPDDNRSRQRYMDFRLYLELPAVTYFMGLFDVGGELMRLAVSEISSGRCETAVNVVDYMRLLFEGYEYLGSIMHNTEWKKKFHTFRESLMKAENALYKWKIRKYERL